MPDDRTLPLHSKEYDWNDDYDCDSFDILEPSPSAAEIPTNLFLVNRTLSAEALYLFHNHTYFRIDITPFGIHTREGLTGPLDNFDNDQVLAKWKSLKCMRLYHLNVKSSSVRWTSGSHYYDIVRDPHTFEDGAERIKEWLRLVCDALVASGKIRNLTITAPCKCAQAKAGLIPKYERTILDLLAPLKRMRVPNSVHISLHDDEKKGEGIRAPCRKSACVSLAKRLRASLSKLVGEALSDREALWKDVKMLKHHDDENRAQGGWRNGYYWYDRPFGIKDIWVCLNGRIPSFLDDHTTFQDAVQKFYARRSEAEIRRLKRKKEYEKNKAAEQIIREDKEDG